MKIKFNGSVLMVAALLLVASCTNNNDENIAKNSAENNISDADDLPSQVISLSDAETDNANWGRFFKYSEGSTYGTKDSLTGTAEINPGQEIHPPHVHAEEEYLMVLEGNGTWHLNGKDFPAKAGDMLYAKPWDIHGIKNSGDIVLKFIVWKWNSKGVPVIAQPKELAAE